MSEIRNWLEGIGLGQHADAFEANIAWRKILNGIFPKFCFARLKGLGHELTHDFGASCALLSSYFVNRSNEVFRQSNCEIRIVSRSGAPSTSFRA
jgi:hypothetical protein